MRSFALLLLPLLAIAQDLESRKEPELAIKDGLMGGRDSGVVVIMDAQPNNKGSKRLGRRQGNSDIIKGGTMAGGSSGVVMVMAGGSTNPDDPQDPNKKKGRMGGSMSGMAGGGMGGGGAGGGGMVMAPTRRAVKVDKRSSS